LLLRHPKVRRYSLLQYALQWGPHPTLWQGLLLWYSTYPWMNLLLLLLLLLYCLLRYRTKTWLWVLP
jgi:hypothetical protein